MHLLETEMRINNVIISLLLKTYQNLPPIPHMSIMKVITYDLFYLLYRINDVVADSTGRYD